MTIRYRALVGPIKHFLRQQDMTVTDLAELLGTDRSSLSLRINGSRPMTWELAAQIASLLNVAPGAIVEPVPTVSAESPSGDAA